MNTKVTFIFALLKIHGGCSAVTLKCECRTLHHTQTESTPNSEGDCKESDIKSPLLQSCDGE